MMQNTPTNQPFTTEDDWTSYLAGALASRADVATGIGDDAAVVRAGTEDWVYTTDAVVEGVHFHTGTEPRRIGHKLAGRLLSDLAAMGAEPAHLLINLVVPPACTGAAMVELYKGAGILAAQFGAAIIGGDTLRASPLALHGFASGRLPTGAAVLRSGARTGDVLYVTGCLGGSLAGRHLDFMPRVREGIWLRAGGWATAMMDLSDGLARDLPRLCRASNTGAVLDEAAIPTTTTPAAALTDGEDYELLFTVNTARTGAFESAWRAAFADLACTAIGQVQACSAGITLRRPDGRTRPLAEGGFDHFA